MLCRLSIVVFFLSFAAQTQAQMRIEAAYFSDLSTPEKITVFADNIWLMTHTAFVRLDTNGRVLDNFSTPPNRLFTSYRISLLIGENNEPFIYYDQAQRLLRWDIQQQTWTEFPEFKGKKVFARSDGKNMWIETDSSFALFKNGTWEYIPKPFSPIKFTIALKQNSKGETYWVGLESALYHYDKQRWRTIPLIQDIEAPNLLLFRDTLFYINKKTFWQGDSWQPMSKQQFGQFGFNSYDYYVNFDGSGFLQWNIEMHKHTLRRLGSVPDVSDAPFINQEREALKAVTQAANGDYYFALTKGIIYRKRGSDWKRIEIQPSSPVAGKLGAVGDSRAFNDQEGRLWLPSSEVVGYWEKDKWHTVADSLWLDTKRTPFALQQFAQSKAGNLYATDRYSIYERLPSGHWKERLKDENLRLYQHSKGHICALNPAGKHYDLFDDGNTAAQNIAPYPTNSTNYVFNKIYTDSSGLWIHFPGDTNFVHYKDGRLFVQYSIPNGDSSYCMKPFFARSKDGNLFILSPNEYKPHLPPQNLSIISPSGKKWRAFQIKPATKIQADSKGNIWAFHADGVRQYGSKSKEILRFIPLPREIKATVGNAHIDRQQRIWYIDQNGVYVQRLSDGKTIATLAQKHLTFGSTFHEDAEGNIWLFGCSFGAARLRLP